MGSCRAPSHMHDPLKIVTHGHMLIHPNFDPVAFQLGPISVHWYGLTYLVAFALFLYLGRKRLKHPNYLTRRGCRVWTKFDVEDLLYFGVIGAVVGGRLGYCIFYNPVFYWDNPAKIMMVWDGGMSFHGGILGVIVAIFSLARIKEISFLTIADFAAPCIPLGLASGRLGNFVNGELWGRTADPELPWAMVFSGAGSMPRHPSQIYQFLLEGLLLFVLLWLYAQKSRKLGEISGAFLLGYGALRFAAEFFREPDAQLGLLSLGMSMGQWLCLPMVLAGTLIWVRAQKIDLSQ